ncbi:MAG: hypothetical protein U0990_03910 [Candidatus Nanopelagicales bacterium]|nr:hypothetical protein [Candidatus Nanopelagicales bacterium]MDZ4249219.1 hypothetical protein [Candidatus Nanopelagicales bacterium]
MHWNKGLVAAWVALLWSWILGGWWMVDAALPSSGIRDPNYFWVMLAGVTPPLALTAICVVIQSSPSARFKVRLVCTLLFAVYAFGLFILGLYFMPALAASVISTIQSRVPREQ